MSLTTMSTASPSMAKLLADCAAAISQMPKIRNDANLREGIPHRLVLCAASCGKFRIKLAGEVVRPQL